MADWQAMTAWQKALAIIALGGLAAYGVVREIRSGEVPDAIAYYTAKPGVLCIFIGGAVAVALAGAAIWRRGPTAQRNAITVVWAVGNTAATLLTVWEVYLVVWFFVSTGAVAASPLLMVSVTGSASVVGWWAWVVRVRGESD